MLDCIRYHQRTLSRPGSAVDSNGLIKVKTFIDVEMRINPSYAKSLSWKIEVHILWRASAKSAASFALSKSRRIAFSIRLMDTAEVFNLRTRHVLRFRYISLILHHTQNVSLMLITLIMNYENKSSDYKRVSRINSPILFITIL